MKFLIITNHSYMLWQFRRELITDLQKYGDIVISMPFTGHEDDFKKIGCKCINTEINRRGINPITDLRLYITYRKILKAEKPNMVITYSIKPNIYGGFSCLTKGIPYCVNVQGLGTAFQNPKIAIIVTLMYKVALKKAHTVFFENQADADEFISRNIVSIKQQKVLNGAGVNLNFFQEQPYPTENNGIHFLFLGRIMREKGVDELFDVARKLKKKYGSRIIFDLVGFFEESYKSQVESLVQEGIVVFHGFQSDPRPFYKNAHCIVLPSYHEGMSNVLLEAAATGRAIITSDIPGCRETVNNGINGFLCQKMSVDSLRDAIECFMGKDFASRREMGTAGRQRMIELFDKRKVVSETLQSIIPDQ